MISIRFVSRVIIFFMSLSILFSFQNCSRVQFSNQLQEDLASSDFCTANPTAQECLDASQVTSCLFNGQVVKSGETVLAYQNSAVPFGSTCVSQTRRCDNGVLSESYNFASCTIGAPSSCLFNGQTIPHQGAVTAYQNSSVPSGSTCVSQQRTCSNGTLSGTYNMGSCVVNAPVACMFNGQTVPNGQSVTAYQTSSVGFGQSCVSQPRTCNNGALSGTYTFSSCAVNAPNSCLFNGQTIAHGQSVTAYANGSVQYGQMCLPTTRTCNDGVLSGSGNFATCAVSGPANCLFAGMTLSHNQQVVAYNSTSVPFGQSCSKETRVCNNGTMSGTASYQYLSCQTQLPRSCSFNGQSVPHGSSVTAYFQSLVPYGQSCATQAQTRTCNDSVLSGSAPYAGCSVDVPPCAPGEVRDGNGVCVSTSTVTNTSSSLANSLCVDHHAYFQFEMIGNEIVLWAWGTDPSTTIVGWNCADTVTPGYYSYLPPIKIWSQTFDKGYKPEVSLSGTIYGGGGCNASGISFGGYNRIVMANLCPNKGAGTMQYGFNITVTSRPYSGGSDGTPPFPPVYVAPVYDYGGY